MWARTLVVALLAPSLGVAAAGIKRSKTKYDTSYVSIPGLQDTTTIIKPQHGKDQSKFTYIGYPTPDSNGPILEWPPLGYHFEHSVLPSPPTKTTRTKTKVVSKGKTTRYFYTKGRDGSLEYTRSTITRTFTTSITPGVETEWRYHNAVPGLVFGDQDAETYVFGDSPSPTYETAHTDYSLRVGTHRPTLHISAGPTDPDITDNDVVDHEGDQKKEKEPKEINITRVQVTVLSTDVTTTATHKDVSTTRISVYTTKTAETTLTKTIVSTITPPPLLNRPVGYSASAHLSSLSAAASHISVADQYATAGLAGYLRAEWAFWHALQAAKTMRLLNETANLAYPVASEDKAFASEFSSIGSSWSSWQQSHAKQQQTYGGYGASLSAGAGHTVTLTTTVSVLPNITATTTIHPAHVTRDVDGACACGCDGHHRLKSQVTARTLFFGSAIGSPTTTTGVHKEYNDRLSGGEARWFDELPVPVRKLLGDEDTNKLIVLHKGNLIFEYNTGLANSPTAGPGATSTTSSSSSLTGTVSPSSSNSNPKSKSSSATTVATATLVTRGRIYSRAGGLNKRDDESQADKEEKSKSKVKVGVVDATVVRTGHASPVYDDGKRVVIVNHGDIVVKVNDWRTEDEDGEEDEDEDEDE